MTSIADTITRQKRAGILRKLAGRRVLVLVSLVLVMLAGFASLVLVQGIDRQVSDMARTYEVRNQARELTIALAQAESSQLGLMLTGDDAYVEPFRRAAAAIDTRLLSLLAITDDDPAQYAVVSSVTDQVSAKAQKMAQLVDLVGDQRMAEARQMMRADADLQAASEVQRTLELFVGQENEKLLDRNRSIETTRRWLVGAIVAALAGAVILAYLLFARTQREVSALARNRSDLLSENELLEAHIQERTQAVEEARAHAERERQRVEALLQDTNHRIGNSLATVSSLLGLQLLRSKSDEVKNALEAARSRVHAIASSHRRLRLGTDLETASADEFLDAVLEDLATNISGTQPVSLEGLIDPIVIGARDATTLGILVSELVTNALKHAFPQGRAGRIVVTLRRSKDGVPTLSVVDDGIGMANHEEPGDTGLGSVIVKQLAMQFGGSPSYQANAAGGLAVTLPLPSLESASTHPK